MGADVHARFPKVRNTYRYPKPSSIRETSTGHTPLQLAVFEEDHELAKLLACRCRGEQRNSVSPLTTLPLMGFIHTFTSCSHKPGFANSRGAPSPGRGRRAGDTDTGSQFPQRAHTVIYKQLSGFVTMQWPNSSQTRVRTFASVFLSWHPAPTSRTFVHLYTGLYGRETPRQLRSF